MCLLVLLLVGRCGLLLFLLLVLLCGGSLHHLLVLLCGGGLISGGRFWRGGSATRSKLVVVLLRLLELLLELLRVCGKRSNGLLFLMNARLLTLGVREPDGKGLRGRGHLRVVGSDFPHPAPVRANVRLQAHVVGDCKKVSTQTARDVLRAAHALAWFAQTLRVLSRRITRRIFFVSLCCSRRTSPVPRSFHSEDSVANRKSFARLHRGGTRAGTERSAHDGTRWDRGRRTF